MINDVPREALIKYQALLLKWNKAINLVSKNSEQYIWERHIIDSLQLINYMNFSDKLIDIGSGAGFPGIILSIAGVYDVTLVECDSRKAVFLEQAAKLSAGKVTIIATKLDSNFIGECDVLTCRGLSAISNILRMTQGIKRKKLLLLKGTTYKKEILNAQKDWLFNLALHDSITSDKGKILEITDERKGNISC